MDNEYCGLATEAKQTFGVMENLPTRWTDTERYQENAEWRIYGRPPSNCSADFLNWLMMRISKLSCKD